MQIVTLDIGENPIRKLLHKHRKRHAMRERLRLLANYKTATISQRSLHTRNVEWSLQNDASNQSLQTLAQLSFLSGEGDGRYVQGTLHEAELLNGLVPQCGDVREQCKFVFTEMTPPRHGALTMTQRGWRH
ncbi:hypothetical protein JZ785_27260 [Alicyclobacillus curvatus]|nr:hypothetical protein JZ785_27260 [Alicyclobacillus curvatus]